MVAKVGFGIDKKQPPGHMPHYTRKHTEIGADGARRVVENKGHIHVEDGEGRLGVMVVGLAGNNGSTLYAAVESYKRKLQWECRRGAQETRILGSISQYGDIPIGLDDKGGFVYRPVSDMCSLVDIGDIVVGGWDITKCDMKQAMRNAAVLPFGVQGQLSDLKSMLPLPGVFYPGFIANNQTERANHTLPGSAACPSHLNELRRHIRHFKVTNGLRNVVVLWSGSTERMVKERSGIHDSWDNMSAAIERGSKSISPSMMYAAASLQEKCTFLNCSSQNTLVPALVELAEMNDVHTGGRDLKSGQTKLKSAMSDFLLSSGFRMRSVVSYNHLGNNDGRNLVGAPQLRAKTKSKSDVLSDMVATAPSLYSAGEMPDHDVVIRYVPHVRDNKRAFDEYVSEVAMGDETTMTVCTICPDSLLALGVMVDLVLFSDWISRIRYRKEGGTESVRVFRKLGPLSLFFKTGLDTGGTTRFSQQRDILASLILATHGLPPFSPFSGFGTGV